ncbi:MAG TPA: valine--tRNA ligase [Geminicoccaceae bacterium]|nr:valine--tRNA ligase [Geminicoccaceae bacterium]
MLDKTYRPADVEARHDRWWEAGGYFRPVADPDAKPYCIVMPPPNVTGSLHMGHALDNTIQDTLIRFHRMRGYAVLWQPGMDHAGIATQMVVERELAKEGITRRDLGRERFVERVWAWKEESGGAISRQLHRLGASADWSRERFTLDEGLSQAVRKVFVDLHRAGLIYKDQRLVNWDCQLQTAVSDLEVDAKEVDGRLWYIRYPIENGGGRHITVATTRPETMLGDTGVAVHPDDPRYRDLVGQHAILPLVGRRLPIVADRYSDPDKGSGAVKITPGHDFNDFEVGRRHELGMISIIDEGGRLNDQVPKAYQGLDRFAARERVLADLEAQRLIGKIEPIRHTVPYSQRSETPVEPLLSDQWYADAKTLAEDAIRAVEDGRTRFVPQQWESTYFEWMRNIQPWCISRQLWWGHQIPAWYGPDGAVFVAMDEAGAARQAAEHYGRAVPLTQDDDVLDTWFSSALWPFSTLGWPERTPELERFYPTSVLVTGFDIIFFWVARMMMMGLKFMGGVPFHEVYIHGLVRDERGQKMSKSKGNVIDPLELIERYGADALRFTILASTAQGRDIRFGESRVQGYRNFGTKLWNAARFCELNGCELDPDFAPAACRQTVNRWVVSKLAQAESRTRAALESYRFNEAASALYQFTWNEFCDWYLELAKPLLAGDDEEAKAETRATAAWALAQLLHLLHPLTPFVTEELWLRRYGAPGGPLIAAAWAELDRALVDGEAEAELDWLIRAISALRAARNELEVPPAAKLKLVVRDAGPATRARLAEHREALLRLARLAEIETSQAPVPRGSLQVVVDEATFAVPLAGVIDLEQERQRLDKELAKARAEIARFDQKLANPKFLDRAPADVVETQRARRAEVEQTRQKLEAALARIAS